MKTRSNTFVFSIIAALCMSMILATSCEQSDQSLPMPASAVDSLLKKSSTLIRMSSGKTLVVQCGNSSFLYGIPYAGNGVFERIKADSGAIEALLDYSENGDVQALLSASSGLTLDVRWAMESSWIRLTVPSYGTASSRENARCFVLSTAEVLVARRNHWWILDGRTRCWRGIDPISPSSSDKWLGLPSVVVKVDESTYFVGHDVGEWGGSLSLARENSDGSLSVERLTDRSCSHIIQLDSNTYLAAGGVSHLGWRSYSLDIVRNGRVHTVRTYPQIPQGGPVYAVETSRKTVLLALGEAGVVRLGIVKSSEGYRAEVQSIAKYLPSPAVLGERVVTITSDSSALVSDRSNGIYWLSLR